MTNSGASSPVRSGGALRFEETLPSLMEADDERLPPRDPGTFWASHIGFCPRQAYTSKMGLRDTSDVRGRLDAGRLVQSHIESLVAEGHPRVKTDVRAVYAVDGVRIVGRPTCYDPETNTVYHVKTRNGWYNFAPPVERHLDQLHAYMAGLDAERGQLVYVSLNDLADIRTWPSADAEAAFARLNDDRVETLVQKAWAIRNEVVSDGIAMCEEEVPFEPCGCFLCDSESLSFPTVESLPQPGESGSEYLREFTNRRSATAAPDGGVTTDMSPAPSGSRAVQSDGIHVPRELREFDVWVVWDCRQKVALAPWQTGTMYPCEWSAEKDVNPRRPFEKAWMVAELPVDRIHETWPFPEGDDLPETVKPAVLLPHERGDPPLAFVDFDGVRDPNTGKMTKEAWRWLDALGGYAELSRSATGVHAYVRGSLPEDVGAFKAPLDNGGSVEIYDGARFTGGTWRHIEGLPKNAIPVAQDPLDELISKYRVD